MIINKGLYSAVARSMAGRYSVYVCNLVSLMILARMFSPNVYGVIASVFVVYIFFKLFSEAGLGPAVINLDSFDSKERDGVFSVTLLLGIVLGTTFLAMSDVIVAFYNEDAIGKVIPYLSVAIFLFSVSILPNALLLRQQSHFRIANAGVAAEVLSTITTVILFSYTSEISALASKYAVSSLVNFVCLYYFSAQNEFGRPRIGSKLSAIKPLLGFSLYQFSFNFINFFSRNLDSLLIGKYLGPFYLGIYDKSYQLMRYPLMLLTFSMAPAIQPYLRKHKADIAKVESIHRDFTFKLSLLGILVSVGIFTFSDLIVTILLGDDWQSVSPILAILAISIPAQVVSSTSGGFFQALNRVKLLFVSGLLSSFTMISAIVYGVYLESLNAICEMLVIAIYINFFQVYIILYLCVFKESLGKFLFKMLPMLASSAVMFYIYKVF